MDKHFFVASSCSSVTSCRKGSDIDAEKNFFFQGVLLLFAHSEEVLLFDT